MFCARQHIPTNTTLKWKWKKKIHNIVQCCCSSLRIKWKYTRYHHAYVDDCEVEVDGLPASLLTDEKFRWGRWCGWRWYTQNKAELYLKRRKNCVGGRRRRGRKLFPKICIYVCIGIRRNRAKTEIRNMRRNHFGIIVKLSNLFVFLFCLNSFELMIHDWSTFERFGLLNFF